MRSFLNSPRQTRKNKTIPDEYAEFCLCRMFHKLPHEFDEMPNNVVQLWRKFISLENTGEELEMKRQQQKTNHHGK